MVLQIRKLKYVLVLIIILLLSCIAVSVNNNVETNLLKIFLPADIINSTDIIPIGNKSASLIKVLFEAGSETETELLKNKFLSLIDKEYFEEIQIDVSNLIKQYLESPSNFLSSKSRKLLLKGEYDELYQQSLINLYSPTVLQLAPFDKDPYLLFSDFIMFDNGHFFAGKTIGDKYYDLLKIKIKNKEGLSPDLCNKKIKELVVIQKKLSDKNSYIYLAGSPVHSYFTAAKSIFAINFICILSVILIIFLTYIYFKNIKILIPIMSGILIGALTGYIAVNLWFENFQIITLVFSTTLIGIGIDYSYHFCFNGRINKKFVKKLSLSLTTTLLPFILLYMTGIELLKQITVFTVFGLIAIYLCVIIIYPYFAFPKPQRFLSFNRNLFYEISLTVLIIISIAGFTRLRFNDSLTALYTPSQKLSKAEALYNKISGDFSQRMLFITVKGFNIDDILQKEEIITDKLTKSNIEYLALSKFIPSQSRQKDNFLLVRNLYDKNLHNFSDILTAEQITKLKCQNFTPIIFNIKEYSYLSDFLITPNTSVILAFTNNLPNISETFAKTCDFRQDIAKYMKNYREKLLKLFPATFLILGIFLTMFYGCVKGLKLLLPPALGVILSAGLMSFIYGEVNLFSIMSLFLVLGFTMDYSIFRTDGLKGTEDAIFISVLTTAGSFLLLTMTGFKLLSSISIVLFFGIIVSYLTGYLLLSKK